MSSTTDATSSSRLPRPLTIFAFLWACQALEHQEFFANWILANSALGWIVTILAAAAVLWPGSLLLLTGMLGASIVYNVSNWPFVVNHILVESIANVTILLAIGVTWARRRRGVTDRISREEILDRFAPVLKAMLVVVYYYAFIAKLNTGFLNPEVSCVAKMYGDLLHRIPFLPETPSIRMPAIWLTLIVEAAIPLLLTFRRSQPFGILIGLPFHLVLGLIGHRTFSALAFSLYGLFCMNALVYWTAGVQEVINRRVGPERRALCVKLARVGALLLFALVAVELKRESALGFLGFRLAPRAWAAWSLVIALVYVWAIISSRGKHANPPESRGRTRPGLLWAMVLIVILNGSTQYLGLKTQTNFTMYSNLRTEGGTNNHLFMPVFRLFGFQDDLVEVLETDHPGLRNYVDMDLWMTHFEFRRLVSETAEDFQVTYRRGEQVQHFELRQGVSTDPALHRKHPVWLAMLLYFRPVDKAENPRCQH